ncbi:HET-domain-containing protein, partial [Polyplosphaeria fusca]
MDIFSYEPMDLERPAFRLLHLLQGEGLAIECMLYQAYCDGIDTIPYEALSYTWGSQQRTSTVMVNGRTLRVTENLYSALQHLRLKNEDRVLWIDAVCINQENQRERGHQVEQMSRIYSEAEEVIIWLGPATYETDVFMESLWRVEEHYLVWELVRCTNYWQSLPSYSTNTSRKGLSALLMRPWFRRIWILQEVANAKRARVWCGTKSIKARTFSLAPLLVGIRPERHCKAVLDIMPGPSRKNSWWGENRSLYNLLLKFSESEASDPRDKVYALLGISSDAHDTDNLRPDYTKDIQTVVYDTSGLLFGSSGALYRTMPELLANIAALNAEYFCRLLETSDVNEIEHFLMRQ